MHSGYKWVSAEEGVEWPFAQEKVFEAAPVRGDENGQWHGKHLK